MPVGRLAGRVLAPTTRRLLVAPAGIADTPTAGQRAAPLRAVPVTAVAPRAHQHATLAEITEESAAVRATNGVHSLLEAWTARAWGEILKSPERQLRPLRGTTERQLICVVPRSLSPQLSTRKPTKPAKLPPERKSRAHARDDDAEFRKTSRTTALQPFLTTVHRPARGLGRAYLSRSA